jgi:ankyrin repeat protein
MAAAWEGDVRRIEALINAGADVNARDQDLGTPLAAASYNGNPDAVRLLLDRGAEVDAKDGEGMTPLMNASLNGKAEVVRLLLAKGADVNAVSTRTVDGKRLEVTALKLARGRSQADVIEILRRAGAKE